MKAIRFTLSGNSAFFKKPEYNQKETFFTYSHIPKTALLGILGALLGFGGYSKVKVKENKKTKTKATPPEKLEFVSKLKDLKVAIVPSGKVYRAGIPGLFAKTFHTYTNTTGHANDGTLIINEQILENPSWDIYILSGHEFYEPLREKILNRKGVFIPYLGSAAHDANILQAEEVELLEVEKQEGIQIHSLFKQEDFKDYTSKESSISALSALDRKRPKKVDIVPKESLFGNKSFKWEEFLPSGYRSEYGDHNLEMFEYTSALKQSTKEDVILLKENEKNLYFF